MMQNLNYSEEQLRLIETEPTPEDYMNDSQQQHEQRKKLLARLYYLAMSHNHENHLDSMERIRVRRCARLLKLDHDVMGRRAVQIIWSLMTYWQTRNVQAASPQAYEPKRSVSFKGGTFAQQLEHHECLALHVHRVEVQALEHELQDVGEHVRARALGVVDERDERHEEGWIDGSGVVRSHGGEVVLQRGDGLLRFRPGLGLGLRRGLGHARRADAHSRARSKASVRGAKASEPNPRSRASEQSEGAGARASSSRFWNRCRSRVLLGFLSPTNCALGRNSAAPAGAVLRGLSPCSSRPTLRFDRNHS